MATKCLQIPARQIREGDRLDRVPTDTTTTDLPNGRVVTKVESGGGVVGVWVGEVRGKWRPADFVLNHGDPVHVEREETS